MGGQVGEEGTLQTDAAQLYLFVPVPAKAKKLLSIYIFSLICSVITLFLRKGIQLEIKCAVPISSLSYESTALSAKS